MTATRWPLLIFLGLIWCGRGLCAAGPGRSLTLDGRAITLYFAPVVVEGETLVWMRDLEQTGRVRTRWDPTARVGILAARDVVLEVRVGVKEVTLHTTLASGQVEAQTQSLPAAPMLVSGRLMVPLNPLCQALGISTASPPASSLAAEDHPDPQATGAIVGEVAFGDRPLEGVVLRLVRAADSTFVRTRRAVSDGHGRYRFPGVPAGNYRVYAYVGDNPEYFNRQSSEVEVKQSLVSVARLAMGWMILPRLPAAGARVPAGRQILVRWEACPGATEYELSLFDQETQQEVALPRVVAPEALLAADALSPGHHYQVRVVAHGREASFLGSTPGAGASPWVFAVTPEEQGGPSARPAP